MPSMMEIYGQYAPQYDELVSAEDYQGNLAKALYSLDPWKGRAVIEAGIGTGRVTSLYINDAKSVLAFDRSPHMISYARTKLASHSSKITFHVSDHLNISDTRARADIFIEGWSFGHLVIEQSAQLPNVAASLERMIHDVVRPGGTAIIVETLGTCTPDAGAPNKILNAYYQLLEQRFGYAKKVIRTDYRFAGAEEAARIMGFFFGEEMATRVKDAGLAIVPEYTGIWWKSIAGVL